MIVCLMQGNRARFPGLGQASCPYVLLPLTSPYTALEELLICAVTRGETETFL